MIRETLFLFCFVFPLLYFQASFNRKKKDSTLGLWLLDKECVFLLLFGTIYFSFIF